MIYEIHDIRRFPSVQEFASYCRLVKSKKESAGKLDGTSGNKIGNAHLKWAFSEAAGFVSSAANPHRVGILRRSRSNNLGLAPVKPQ
jgi:transposase